MFVNIFLRRFLPFCLAAACGFAAFYLFNQFVLSVGCTAKGTRNTGSGSGSGSGSSRTDTSQLPLKVFLVSKPKATYTDAARENNIEGTVRLRVTLLASGEVGSIVPVTELPDGLTEQAIAAARQIRFEPKTIDGVPMSTVVTIDYGFSIY